MSEKLIPAEKWHDDEAVKLCCRECSIKAIDKIQRNAFEATKAKMNECETTTEQRALTFEEVRDG